MKHYFAHLVLAFAATWLAACSPDDPEHGMQSHQGNHQAARHEHMKMPAGEALSGQSIYQLESTWTNQHGESLRLGALAGQVVVLAMVYTHCDFACPRIIADIRRIRDQVQAEPDEIELVLVSIDPERDTVERLRDFGEKTGLTRQGWVLLRGSQADVRELAAVFGVQYRKTTATDFAHSNIISVLNRRGEIAHQQKGLGVKPDAMIEAIDNLLDDAADEEVAQLTAPVGMHIASGRL